MKKILLSIAVLLSLSTAAFCAENTPLPTQQTIHQKACQNVFSFINFDLSLMSPRATVTDSAIDARPDFPPPPNAVVPIANKANIKPCPPCPICPPDKKDFKPEPPKSKTSLFRLDLLHIFKIQVL